MIDIDNMPAGGEIDRLVAEKLMGWIYWDFKGDWNGPAGKTFFAVSDHFLTVYDSKNTSIRYFTPSVCINDAWVVVERLRELSKISLPYAPVGLEIGDGNYVCILWNITDKVISAHADTMPLAVCRAALKAVKVI